MNAPTLEAKVAYLSRASSYPDAPRAVTAVQTHMSWVFLTDRTVYKLKKPVRYDYLDFSTIEARRQACENELRLNRRLAASVYQETVPLAVDRSGEFALGGTGAVVDWLVKMLRLPAAQMLDAVLQRRDRPVDDAIRAVAEQLARFYASAARVPTTPAAYLLRLNRDICATLESLSAPEFRLPPTRLEQLTSAQHALIGRLRRTLASRARDGRIVDGHGDLRPEHVCLKPLAIIDCIEFNPALRNLDPADDLAFLAMESERVGGHAVGRRIDALLFEAYRHATGDAPTLMLRAFYKSYRAAIRAKLALWHLREPEFHDSQK